MPVVVDRDLHHDRGDVGRPAVPLRQQERRVQNILCRELLVTTALARHIEIVVWQSDRIAPGDFVFCPTKF